MKKSKNFLMRLLCGFGIGFAFIVPGISGSAMAVLFGVYEDMIDSVSNIFKDFKKSFWFLLPIAIGVVLSVGSLIIPITWALTKNCFIVIMLFAGFIIGGLKPMIKQAEWKNIPKWHYIFFIIGFLFVIGISFLTFIDGVNVSLLGQDIALYQYPMMILVGVIFAVSMVLPGVSGATLLLSIGYYTSVFDLLKETAKNALHGTFYWQSYLLILCLVIGVAVGALAMSKLLSGCFKKYPKTSYLAVCGLAIGSIPAMFISQNWGSPKVPGDPFIKLPMSHWTIIFGILLLIVGIGVGYLFVYLKEKKDKKALLETENLECETQTVQEEKIESVEIKDGNEE